jgi:hypothetical protein
MPQARPLLPADVVYDIEVRSGRPHLTLTSVATRRRISHDQAVEIDFLPDIFYLLTAPGSRVATWSANTTAMKASAALFDAEIRNSADIERLSEIARTRAAEKAEALVIKDIHRMASAAIAAGVLRGPTPAPVAAQRLAERGKSTKTEDR